MNKLSKDALFMIALELDLPDLLNFCKSYEKIDKLVCQRNEIWLHKLKEFPNWKEFNIDKDLKDIYETLYDLKVVKEFLKDIPKYRNYSLLELYNLRELELKNNQLTEIPKELGNLTELETLILNGNKLTEIPKELGNLTNLKYLYLYNNKLTEIPKELGNLTNLQNLSLGVNQLTEIPKELGNLVNLRDLDLYGNKLTEIPKELGNLTNLVYLALGLNKLRKIPKEVKKIKGLNISKDFSKLHNIIMSRFYPKGH